MVKEAMKPNPRFAVYYGFDGYVLSTMTAGFGPETSLVDALSQISLAGLFRLVSFFYLNDFWRIIRKCGKESEEQKKSYGSVSMRQASTVTSSDE
jgi:3-dehydrosphinganine reductase